MSGVSIYIHYAGGKYVRASDYDRDTQALKEKLSDRALDQMRQLEELIECQTERDTFKAECVNLNNILDQIRAERDELRALLAQPEAVVALDAKQGGHECLPTA